MIGFDKERDTKTGHQLETQRIMAERKRRRLWWIVGLARGTKGSLIEFSFKSVIDLFFNSKLLSAYRPVWMRKEMFDTPGRLTEWWRGYSGVMGGYLMELQERILGHKKVVEDAERRKREEVSFSTKYKCLRVFFSRC